MIQLRPREPVYPRRLRAIPSPPDPLWIWGTLPGDEAPTVGIVGTRRLTTYGARVAREIAVTLARAGAVIVSGLAQGIDSTAHAGAIDAGGRTIAVLGEGLAWFDDHGPLRRRDLARRIRKQGAVVSEYPLELKARDWTFPRRNATIAGLSDALVVVEAPEGSGSLITAKRMIEIGRPVFAVPGPFGEPTWMGSHRAIARGDARLLKSVHEVAAAAGIDLPVDLPARDRGLADQLMALLADRPVDADEIAKELCVTAADAARLVAEQLIAGRIVPSGDGRFSRVR